MTKVLDLKDSLDCVSLHGCRSQIAIFISFQGKKRIFKISQKLTKIEAKMQIAQPISNSFQFGLHEPFSDLNFMQAKDSLCSLILSVWTPFIFFKFKDVFLRKTQELMGEWMGRMKHLPMTQDRNVYEVEFQFRFSFTVLDFRAHVRNSSTSRISVLLL